MAAFGATIVTSLLILNTARIFCYFGFLPMMLLGSSGPPPFYIATSGVWEERARSPFPIS